jgi:hypothetical protein
MAGANGGPRLRSRAWWDDSDNPGMTAGGVTLARARAGQMAE